MKIILKHILRNIWEKKGRSFLIILALAVATTVFTLNLTLPGEIVLKVQETMRSVYGNVDITATTVEEFNIDSLEWGTEDIKYTGLLSLEFMLSDEQALIYSVDIDTAKDMKLLGVDAPDLKENELIISKDQAEKHKFEKGSKISFTYEDKSYEFVVAEIVENKGINALAMEFPLFVGDISDIAKIRKVEENIADTLFIDVIDDDNVKTYADYFGDKNENFMIQCVSDTETIKEQTSFISYLMLMIFAMATIMIMFVISSLNKIIVAERMPVIGTFRSIGATKGKMNAILVLENAMYGLIGGVIGAYAGYAINSNVAGLFITTSGVELTKETAKIDVGLFLLGVTFSVILQIIITSKAIIKANKKPIKDIIFDVHSTRYRVQKHRVIIGLVLLVLSLVLNKIFKDINILVTILAIVLLISGVAMLVPFLLQQVSKFFAIIFKKLNWSTAYIASKNIGYNKMIVSSSRVVVVALSLMIAIITVSNSFTGLFQSFRLMVDDYDVVIQNVTKNEQEYYKLLELEEIEKIEYLHCYYDEATTYNGGKKFNNIPTFVGMKEGRKYIDELNYKIQDLSYDEILIDEVFAEKNDIQVDDYLNIDFGTLNKELKLKVVGTVNSTYFQTTRSTIIMNYDNYIENVYGVPMQVQLKVKDGVDMEELKEKINDLLKELNLNIQTVDEYITEQEESTASIMSLFYVIIGLAVILSFIGIINNQVIGFMQRRKEIAVLNSTCMSKKQLKNMMFFETVLANIIAGVIGVITGFFATDMIDSFLKGMSMYVKVEYSFLSAGTFTLIILLVLLFTLNSPIKRLMKMNLVSEIKYE